MTSMLHRASTAISFDHRRLLAELEPLVNFTAAVTSLARMTLARPWSDDEP